MPISFKAMTEIGYVLGGIKNVCMKSGLFKENINDHFTLKYDLKMRCNLVKNTLMVYKSRYLAYNTLGSKSSYTASLGEATAMDTCHCPEMSRDANGLTGITEIRFYLMWLGYPKALQSQNSTSEGMFFVSLKTLHSLKGFYFFHKINLLHCEVYAVWMTTLVVDTKKIQYLLLGRCVCLSYSCCLSNNTERRYCYESH